MIQQNTLNNKNRVLSFGAVLILPVLFVFDILLYVLTRPSCMTCGSVGEYIKTVSMSGAILGDLVNKTVYLFKNKNI